MTPIEIAIIGGAAFVIGLFMGIWLCQDDPGTTNYIDTTRGRYYHAMDEYCDACDSHQWDE